MDNATATSSATAGLPIRRRLVCFLSGFDPRGPAHYHTLYREAAAAQAALTGHTVAVGSRSSTAPHVASWSLHSQTGTQATDTRYDFLRWDDLVRRHWPTGALGAWRAAAYASWHLWRAGVMWDALKTSWPSFFVMATPGLLLIAFALCLFAVVTVLVMLPLQATALPLVALLLLIMALALLTRQLERRAHMGWLSRSMASLVHQARGDAPEVEARLDAMALHVHDAWFNGGFDELLVVGHSSGAMMAMSVVARALRHQGTLPAPTSPTALALLTLGHCAPVLSGQAGAEPFRADLATLLQSPALCWIDYGAPPDGCCFPLVDPSARVASGKHRPRVMNPRFAESFSPEAYRMLRADYFRCHFQYLMAGERATDYDYLAMTSGPQSLLQRHQGRSSAAGFRRFRLFAKVAR